MPGADRRALAFLTVLTLLLGYLLTSYRTWSNLRYFALLYPLLALLAFAALLRLGMTERLRGAVIGAIVGLFLLASYRSVDPVSRTVYGTFSIGERQMYRMARSPASTVVRGAMSSSTTSSSPAITTCRIGCSA